jgi:hypothetical protein
VSTARPSSEPGGRGDQRLADLADALGVELPPFAGPLVVFDPADQHGPGDPIYLGGDLHAVHPDAPGDPGPREPDPSLDNATLTFGDIPHPWPEAVAVEGIWCVVLEGELTDLSPFFMLWDDLGRLRTWLLLPPASAMIGEGHLWLPSVPPPSQSIGPGPSGSGGAPPAA